MKYFYRFGLFILFCLKWFILPVFTVSVNIVAVLWHLGKPKQGWFKLEYYDWYWNCENSTEQAINRLTNVKNNYYKNPWDILINKKSTY